MGLARYIVDRFSRFASRSCPSAKPGESDSEWLGREGERLATLHLPKRGYKVLARNFRAPSGGEVDLVCRDIAEKTLVFLEVKTRRGLTHGSPAEAVTRAKQDLIVRGARAWLELLDNPEVPARFDILEIVMQENEPTFHLIKDAFHLPEERRGAA